MGLSPEEDFSVSLINCQHPTDRNFNVRSWNTLPSSSRQDACLTSDATRQDRKLSTAASLLKLCELFSRFVAELNRANACWVKHTAGLHLLDRELRTSCPGLSLSSGIYTLRSNRNVFFSSADGNVYFHYAFSDGNWVSLVISRDLACADGTRIHTLALCAPYRRCSAANAVLDRWDLIVLRVRLLPPRPPASSPRPPASSPLPLIAATYDFCRNVVLRFSEPFR